MTQLLAGAALGELMLSRKQTAERLGVTARWLEVNAEAGPAFYRLNASTIRYAEEDVANWSRGRRDLPSLPAVVAARSDTLRLTQSEVARFASAIRRTDECWEWIGARCKDFYGQIDLGGVMVPAHRVAYFLAQGDISDSLDINQTCHNRGCVRPEHLRALTSREGRSNGSGMAGVTWWPERSKWRASVSSNGERHYVGTFEDLGDAKSAVLAKRADLYGSNEFEGAPSAC